MFDRRACAVAAVLALVLALGLAWPFASEFFAIDRCLDAGGSFDYAKIQCDFAVNHPYVPTWDRHGFSLLAAFGLAIVACAVVMWRKGREPK
jgi:hypothetical protein